MRFHSKEYNKRKKISKGKVRWFAWYPVEFGEEPSIHWLEFCLREYDPIGGIKYWHYPIEEEQGV